MFQHKLVVEQEMLYYASVVMGQSLMRNMMGKNEIRRDALIYFVNACRYTQSLEINNSKNINNDNSTLNRHELNMSLKMNSKTVTIHQQDT